MKVVGIYSFKHGHSIVSEKYPEELAEILGAIASIDASLYKNKVSEEITTTGTIFYSPKGLNVAFKEQLLPLTWKPVKVQCEYPTQYYVSGYHPGSIKGAFREMDFVKNRVGIEVQFGKYSFMVYNVAAKMTIFHKLGHIDVGVEIVPAKDLAAEMSSGVSYFEQLAWDLDQRGTSDIDIPVLVLGITKDTSPKTSIIREQQTTLWE
jgi:hypothetical protein